MKRQAEIITPLIARSQIWRQWMLDQARESCSFEEAPAIISSYVDHATLTATWIIWIPHASGKWQYTVWLLERDDVTPRLVYEQWIAAVRARTQQTYTGQLAHALDQVAVDGGIVYVRDRFSLIETHQLLSDYTLWLRFKRSSAQPYAFAGTPPRLDVTPLQDKGSLLDMDRKQFKVGRQEAFRQAVGLEIQQVVWTQQKEPVFYLPTKVTNSALDLAELDAAWVLLQHSEITERFPYSPVWRVGRFTYSLWRLRWQQPRRVLYERSIIVERLTPAPLTTWQLRGDLDRLFIHNEIVGVRDRALGWLRFDKDNQLLP